MSETKDAIICGQNAVQMNWSGRYVLIDDEGARICVPLSDAPAVAAALLKLAGVPDQAALIERLCEALEDAGTALDWAARQMKGNCRGSAVSATMLAASRTAAARAYREGRA